MKYSTRLLLLLTVLAPLWSLAAEPKLLAMQVGYTTTVAMGAPVSKVTLDDPSLVEVTKKGRRVVLVARETGRTEMVVKTANGVHRFAVLVAKDKYGMP